MTGRIVGLFSHAALSVAPSLPAHAREASGTIAAWNGKAGTIELTDGSVFCVPRGLNAAALGPGTQVHLLYD